MLKIERSNQFKKDVKRVLKRGKNSEKLKEVIDSLFLGQPLPEKNKDHKLIGE